MHILSKIEVLFSQIHTINTKFRVNAINIQTQRYFWYSSMARIICNHYEMKTWQ